ncbi:MAG: RteC domain-containing protein [Dysgonomonas sp.]
MHYNNLISHLRWTGTKADLVELAYSLLETKRFNNGEVTIANLTDRVNGIFRKYTVYFL